MPCLTEELEVTVTKVFDARWLILIHFSCSEDKIEMTSYRFMYQNVPHLPRSTKTASSSRQIAYLDKFLLFKGTLDSLA